MIKMKPGDVCEDGTIYSTAEFSLQSGIVVIHRSRLRRAQRFGWKVAGVQIVSYDDKNPKDYIVVMR